MSKMVWSALLPLVCLRLYQTVSCTLEDHRFLRQLPSPLDPMANLDSRLEQLSALAEPVRRALYAFVVGQRAPVTREEAATGVDVAVHVAKFHLDRLVDD